MSEAEWPACADPTTMLEFLRGKSSDRKWRLFLCGCIRLVPPSFISVEIVNSVEQAEAFVDGHLSLDVLNALRSQNPPSSIVLCAKKILWQSSKELCAFAVRARIDSVEGIEWQKQKEVRATLLRRERPVFANLLRDIFGNPFRPVTLDPHWLSSTVLDLARTIYDERVFERLPILADALMDAGCDSEEIIKHCHSEGPHVRGCWVVDLLLGKD